MHSATFTGVEFEGEILKGWMIRRTGDPGSRSGVYQITKKVAIAANNRYDQDIKYEA